MALPAQVRKQVEAVDKLYEEITSDTPGANDTPAKAGEADANDPEGKPSDEGKTGKESKSGKTADDKEEHAPASPPKEQTGGDDTDEKTFEQKYRSLQGMYNAEVPRLHAERRELTNRVQQLEQLLASMNEPPAGGTPSDTPPQKLISDDDVAEYGDSIDVMRKVYQEEVAPYKQRVEQLEQLIRQMQTSVVPQVQQLSHSQAVNSEQAFWASLQANVPDWQEVNNDPDFQSWLLEADPLTGIPRQTYLDAAQRDMDAGRVARFFQTWKGQTGGAEAQPSRQAQTASELEKQVAPGKGRSSGHSIPEEPKTYSTKDIQKFYTDVQKGRYRGRDDERSRIERDIFTAQREGRITDA